MALLRFKLAGYNIGVIRNPKCASTSTISYILQACGVKFDKNGELPNYTKFTNLLGKDSYIGRRKPFNGYEKELLECDFRIAIWRDPIEKLSSGYSHCIAHQFIKETSLDMFLENYNIICKKSNINVWDHCSPNSTHLGNDKRIFTHIYNHKEVDTHLLPMLRVWSGNPIIKQHMRPGNKETQISPSNDQIEKMKSLMEIDYKVGWN